MLAQARATGHVIRTALTSTDPGTGTTRSGTGASTDRGGTPIKEPPALAPYIFTTRHWIAFATIAIVATAIALVASK